GQTRFLTGHRRRHRPTDQSDEMARVGDKLEGRVDEQFVDAALDIRKGVVVIVKEQHAARSKLRGVALDVSANAGIIVPAVHEEQMTTSIPWYRVLFGSHDYHASQAELGDFLAQDLSR